MRRCTGPCGRLLTDSDFRNGITGACWDCENSREPQHSGHDVKRPGS